MSLNNPVLPTGGGFHGIPVPVASGNEQTSDLQQEEDRYRQLIERCVDAIFLLHGDIIVGANRAAAKLVGAATTDTLHGCCLREVLVAPGAAAPAALDIPLENCPASYDRKLLLPDCNVIDAEITVAPYLERDNPGGRVLVVRDVSARKRIAAALVQQDQYLHLITDAVPALIGYVDRELRYRFVNAAYEQWFGQPRAAIVGKTVRELLGADDYAAVEPQMQRALHGDTVRFESSMMRGARAREVVVVYTPDRDRDGGISGFSIIVTDITDVARLRDAEARLLLREREFQTLVENSPDIISRIDRQMRHVYVNPAVEKLGGPAPQAYIGKTKRELGMPESLVTAWEQAVEAAFDSSAEQRLEFEVRCDGQVRHFSGRVVPELERGGSIESVVAIVYEVTERARMEKERDELLARERSARIHAETAARARDEFLAIVSHELRAPLNGIQSWAHVLENYVKDATSAPLAQRALAGIKTGVGQQVRLIEDLLDVTRMMSGKLRLVRQPLALLPTLQAAVESLRPMAAAKRIAISCTYRITTEQIEGDADRIQQIFWNLLSNAIKFTPDEGNVWLNASHSEREICVTVRDNGVGIAPEFLPQLFDRFSQADTSSTRKHSGLGLGLFLVRHLVELHGGRVKAESQGEGHGTTFTVHFPLRARTQNYAAVTPYDETSIGTLPLPSLQGLRILLVDDQEEARESLKVVLSSAGAQVHAAESGNQALAWLGTRPQHELPDVLVCDIAMPGEDGYSALRRLRAWQDAHGNTPLARMPALALTAFAHREDRIRALTAGFQMHVTKPVAAEELIVVIDTMITRR